MIPNRDNEREKLLKLATFEEKFPELENGRTDPHCESCSCNMPLEGDNQYVDIDDVYNNCLSKQRVGEATKMCHWMGALNDKFINLNELLKELGLEDV